MKGNEYIYDYPEVVRIRSETDAGLLNMQQKNLEKTLKGHACRSVSYTRPSGLVRTPEKGTEHSASASHDMLQGPA
jgi:hypothetical protein